MQGALLAGDVDARLDEVAHGLTEAVLLVLGVDQAGVVINNGLLHPVDRHVPRATAAAAVTRERQEKYS